MTYTDATRAIETFARVAGGEGDDLDYGHIVELLDPDTALVA